MGISIARNRFAGALAAVAAFSMAGPAAAAPDPDEAALLENFEKVEVWHFPVDTTVRYNDQTVVVTRELVFKDELPKGQLCYVRFDLVNGEGDYGYGLQPAGPPGERKNNLWGVNVLKRGTILDQRYSKLRLNVIYFFVEGPKSEGASAICAAKQAAPTAEAGNAYQGPWAELVTRARAVRGWPAPRPK